METLIKTCEELGLGLYVAGVLAGFEAAARFQRRNDDSSARLNAAEKKPAVAALVVKREEAER